MNTPASRANHGMRGLCGTLAVLSLIFCWVQPMVGLQSPVPAPNGQSVTQQLHQPRRAALIPIEMHWAPVVRTIRDAAPDGESRTAKPVSTGVHGDVSRWVIPLRI